jgi:IMP cyclohydrolase
MNVYEAKTLTELIKGNPYVGRGLVSGLSTDGKYAVAAYFIMGRSENSRNRVFKTYEDGTVYTAAFDESKVKDPSLIIYNAVRQYGDRVILTNGDQTDTVYEGFEKGLSFDEALESREFEPDAPNFTPRISLCQYFGGKFSYRMSILKSADEKGSACARYGFSYPALPGVGHFIHTYVTDGDPLPTFMGEPERTVIDKDIDGLTEEIWNALDENNKISLYVRYTCLESGCVDTRLINKNK